MKIKITLFTMLVIVLAVCPFVLAANSDAQNTSDASVYCISDPNDIEYGE